jgi:hypothetical protein
MSSKEEYHRTFLSGFDASQDHAAYKIYGKQTADAILQKKNSYKAFIGGKEGLLETRVSPKPDQDFESFSTEWERAFSTLIKGRPNTNSPFYPVVNENLIVTFHFGSIDYWNVVARRNALDSLEGPRNFFSDIASLQQNSEPIFILPNGQKLDSAVWSRLTGLGGWKFRMLVSIDGLVAHCFGGEGNGQTEESLLDPTMLLGFGRAGAKIITRIGKAFAKVEGGTLKNAPRIYGGIAAAEKAAAQSATKTVAREAEKKIVSGSFSQAEKEFYWMHRNAGKTQEEAMQMVRDLRNQPSVTSAGQKYSPGSPYTNSTKKGGR